MFFTGAVTRLQGLKELNPCSVHPENYSRSEAGFFLIPPLSATMELSHPNVANTLGDSNQSSSYDAARRYRTARIAKTQIFCHANKNKFAFYYETIIYLLRIPQ
jgi:hypothetical protein